MLYVIKNDDGAFVSQHSNGKELNYSFCDIEIAEHYTESMVKVLKERFKGTWREKGFTVHKIIMRTEKVNL